MKPLLWLAIICAVACAGTARAYTCNFTKQNINFGDYYPTSNSDVQVKITVKCRNTSGNTYNNVPFVLNFTPGQSGTAAQEYMTDTNSPPDQMNYNVYADPAYSQILGPTPGYSDITGTINVAPRTTSSLAITIYARVPAYQTNLASGYNPYTDTGIGVALTYTNQNNTQKTTATKLIAARARVIGNCRATTPGKIASDVAFGTLDPSAATGDQVVTSNVSVECTKTTPFEVVMNAGQNPATPGDTTTRRMIDLAGDYLPYHLYSDPAHTLEISDSLQGNYLSGSGQGLTTPVSIPFYAVVKLSDLQVATAGNYSDTVTVTLYY